MALEGKETVGGARSDGRHSAVILAFPGAIRAQNRVIRGDPKPMTGQIILFCGVRYEAMPEKRPSVDGPPTRGGRRRKLKSA
jgi:hypothetical protein